MEMMGAVRFSAEKYSERERVRAQRGEGGGKERRAR